jgi:hypothetical protein
MTVRFWQVIVICLIVECPFVLWQTARIFWDSHVYNARLKLVPKALGVTEIVYADEKSFSFIGGPGDNEGGLFVYVLPAASAQLIAGQGLDYVNSLDLRQGGNQETDAEWSSAPVKTPDWACKGWHNRSKEYAKASVHCFFKRHGNWLSKTAQLNARINQIDQVLQMPGTYFWYNKGGYMLILSPKTRRAYYLYST